MTPQLGVVIVTYNASDVIRDCLETLLVSPQAMRVVVVDNASSDNTVKKIKDWREGSDGYVTKAIPFETTPCPKPINSERLEVIEAPRNGGFASGVNIGLKHLLKEPAIDRFWILNPDTLVPPKTPLAFAAAQGEFGLMGGRILYAEPPHSIQIDGGTINRWTGVTGNLNLGRTSTAPLPKLEALDFISGASMVASRQFIEQAGLMPEDYFLYYEEVDWAQRSTLPLRICGGAEVFHRAGSAIGSPTLTAVPSPMSAYYKNRARLMYLRKYHPHALATGFLYGMAKALQFFCQGHRAQARATIAAVHGFDLPDQALSADKGTKPGDQPIKRGT